MIKLLIISDDFTGALDTSVKLVAGGAITYVMLDTSINMDKIAPDADVLVIDTESRHLKKEEAYQIVYSIVRQAQKIGIPFIYKKTDSVLRGNIGAELTAVLNTGRAEHIHFIPAYPQTGRTTQDGIQYVHGVPVAESVFGKDPFEPVLFSSIPEIIATQSDVETHIISTKCNSTESTKGILVYDSMCSQDLKDIAVELMLKKDMHLIAGCAGFAEILPQILGISGKSPVIPELKTPMLIACGSIHPVSIDQCAYAERKGAAHYCLTPEQKLNPAWVVSSEADALIQRIYYSGKNNSVVILNANGMGEPEKTRTYAYEKGISPIQIRTDIVYVMGILIERLIEIGLNGTIFITGGDLLFQFMKQAGIKAISPVCELESGVVLSQIVHKDKKLNIISKSGGFGHEALLMDLSEKLINNRK